jgi:GDP/UDP-N,N'-diacetylbacillosamine 2-epimerase (hydrolysing)
MKKILVVTSSRADYYLLRPLILKLKMLKDFQLEIIATGSHHLKNHGYTVQEIERDFLEYHSIKILNSQTNSLAIQKNLPHYLKKFLAFFNKSNPDLVILLGDRYEVFLAAIASLFNAIPIAHIHGGEVTHGAIDDPMRHSITKMSNFHFVSNSSYKKRVTQLGENPKNIFNVGPMVLDNLIDSKFLSKGELCKLISINKLDPFFLITIHPETYGEHNNLRNIQQLLKALQKFSNYKLIFTAPNVDLEADIIRTKIYDFVKENSNSFFFDSLGSTVYLSLMRYSLCVIGNSSSGIIEAPLLGVKTVNIGSRQSGRVMSKTIFSSSFNSSDIFKSINRAITDSSKKSLLKLSTKDSPSSKIIEIIQKTQFPLTNHKKFYDII